MWYGSCRTVRIGPVVPHMVHFLCRYSPEYTIFVEHSDHLPSYPSDIRHCSAVVYWTGGRGWWNGSPLAWDYANFSTHWAQRGSWCTCSAYYDVRLIQCLVMWLQMLSSRLQIHFNNASVRPVIVRFNILSSVYTIEPSGQRIGHLQTRIHIAAWPMKIRKLQCIRGRICADWLKIRSFLPNKKLSCRREAARLYL